MNEIKALRNQFFALRNQINSLTNPSLQLKISFLQMIFQKYIIINPTLKLF